MGNKYKTLAKDIVIFAIGNIGSKMILFFLVPLYTNTMTKDEYGIADLILTVSELVLPFVSVVIYDALLRFALSKNESKEDTLLVAYIVMAVGSALTLAITPIFIFYRSVSPWKWFLCIHIILSGFHLINMNYLKVTNNNVKYAIISLVQTLFMATLNIVLLVVYHMGVLGYLVANILSVLIAIILTLILGKIPSSLKKARFRKKLFSEMVRYSAPLIFNNISWWVVHSSDKMMVEGMLGEDSLGIYAVSAKIPSFINVIINVFSQAWGISSVKEFENTNDRKFYSSVFNLYMFLCFGVGIGIISVTKLFMKMYVSEAFYSAWKYVPTLLAAAAFAAVAYYYGSLYGAVKKSGRNMVTTLIAAITNVIVNVICIPLWGIYGAAIGTLVSYIVMSTMRMIDINRLLKIKIDYVRYILSCILILIQVVFVTLDRYGYYVSAAAVVLFILTNAKLVKESLAIVKNNRK